MKESKTYIHGWLCSDEWMQSAIFTPWVNLDDIAKKLDENCEFVNILVSNKIRTEKNIIEAICKIGRINKNIVWLNSFLVGFKIVDSQWLVASVDNVYMNNNSNEKTICMNVKWNNSFILLGDSGCFAYTDEPEN